MSLIVATLLGSTLPSSNWAASFAGKCPRCVSAARERNEAPLPVPERAIVYSFNGEFAKENDWWLIDLDTGSVVLRKSAASSVTLSKFDLDHEDLNRLRTAAGFIWHQPSSRVISFAPGAFVDAVIVNGGKMAAYDPFDSTDKIIDDAVKDIISKLEQPNAPNRN